MWRGEETLLDKSFIYWLDLIVQASGSYDVDSPWRLRLNGEVQSAFEYSLDDYYQDFQEALENALANIADKLSKLNHLVRYLAEVHVAGLLLEKNEAGAWHHRNFEFWKDQKLEKTAEVDESNFQVFYFMMDSSLRKMTLYLDTIRQNILAIDQRDMPVPTLPLEDSSSSTVEQPIAYFDWFFARSGLAILREEFKMKSEEEGLFFSESHDARIWDQPLDDEGREYKIAFAPFGDHLKDVLVKELDKSNQLIATDIGRQQSHAAVQLRLELLLSSLDYFHKLSDTHELYRRYSICTTIVETLQQFIQGKYGFFLPEALKGTASFRLLETAADKLLEETRVSSAGGTLTSFKIFPEWIKSVQENLHRLLIENQLIAKDTPAAIVKKAFDGSEIKEPLRIKWISRGRNNLVNKQSLLYFLNRMAEAHIVLEETTNAGFLKRVEMIFSDARGEKLRHLKVSNANTGKSGQANTTDKQKIDDIVAKLKS